MTSPRSNVAYRRKAKELHPDKAGNNCQALEKFHAVQRAYDVLMDDAARAEYDRFGDAAEGKSARAEAEKMLALMIVPLIDKNDARRTDVIRELANVVVKGRDELRAVSEEDRARLENLREGEARLAGSERTAGIRLAVTAAIGQLERKRQNLEFQDAIAGEALALLQELKYRVEPPEVADPFPVGNFSFMRAMPQRPKRSGRVVEKKAGRR